MRDTIAFPSHEWFEALAARMRADVESFHKLGPIDCTMVVKVEGPEATDLFEVTFESFEVTLIRRLESLEAADLNHFVIEAPLAAWRGMIENIRANGKPDLEHTLNYLTFPDDPMLVSGPDQLQIDTFYRYNQSLQSFFNGAAAVETSYAQ
jgi:hypothetical protein